ncbi:MAG: PEGA domain-containing protein [Sandaracinaceae bacterium]
MTHRQPSLLLLLASALAVLAAPGAVDAQTCALLRPGTPPQRPAPEQVSMQAIDAATDALAARDLTVLRLQDAQTRLMADPNRDCHEVSCAPAVANALGVDFVVLVTVWTQNDAPQSVVITLIDGSGANVAGDATVASASSEGGLPTAAQRAVAAALSRYESSRTGRLIVHTEPEGALIEIDGQDVGRSPVERLVPTGVRTVRATEGDRTAEREVTVGAGQPTEVTLRLEGGGGGGGADILMAIGIPLLIGGVGLAVAVPVAAEVTSGCIDRVGPMCTRFRELDVPSVVGWAIAGGVLAATGLTLVIVAATSGGGSTTRARIGPGSFFVEGSF